MKKKYGSTSPKPVWLLLVLFFLVGVIVAGTAVAQEDPPPPDTFPMEHPDFPGVYIINREQVGNSVNETITIPIAEDAFIASGTPNTNYGGSTTLGLGYNSSNGQNAMRILLDFNLAAIPPDTSATSATFNVYQMQVNPSNDGNHCFRSDFASTDWSENGVTWANAAGLGGNEIGIGCYNNSIGWHALDATQPVNYALDNTTHGVYVTGDEGPQNNRSRYFYSKEQSVNLCGGPYGCAPYLTVTYSTQCDNQAPISSVSALPVWSQQYFTVSWSGYDTAPSGCTPTGIANYSVQYRINGGGWTDWRNFVTQTSDTYGEAGNAQFVEFRVRARDHAGNVTDWNVIGPTASTTVDALAPNATINPLPEFSLSYGDISWTGTDSQPGSGIHHYDIQYRSNGGAWINLLSNAPAGQTSYHYNNAPGGLYELRARAVDNVGNVQPWGNPQASTTVVAHPVADMNPISPNIVTDPAATSLPISWTVHDFGYPVSTIQIWVKQGTGNWAIWNTFGGSERNATFTFSPGDTVYQLEAVAISSNPSQSEPRNSQAESSFILDQEAPYVEPVAYLPVVSQSDN